MTTLLLAVAAVLLAIGLIWTPGSIWQIIASPFQQATAANTGTHTRWRFYQPFGAFKMNFVNFGSTNFATGALAAGPPTTSAFGSTRGISAIGRAKPGAISSLRAYVASALRI